MGIIKSILVIIGPQFFYFVFEKITWLHNSKILIEKREYALKHSKISTLSTVSVCTNYFISKILHITYGRLDRIPTCNLYSLVSNNACSGTIAAIESEYYTSTTVTCLIRTS